jgi:acetyl esterase
MAEKDVKERKLNPRIAVLLLGTRLLRKQFWDVRKSPGDNRRSMEADSRLAGGRGEKVFCVNDYTIREGLAVRVYHPSAGTGLPAILFIHGGGWAVGSIDTHDNICRRLANRAGAVVISVGYRLAPENKYPCALEDVYSALQWACSEAGILGINPGKLAVAGDSAGGNLSAALCLLARARGGPPIRFQALIYPAVDAAHLDTESYRLNGKGYYLTKKNIEQVIPLYINKPDDVYDPYISPLLSKDLGGLPPGHIITAEFDPLVGEGEAYSARLSSSGVPCSVHRYLGMIHGFVSFTGFLPQAGQAIDEVARAIRDALGTK